MNDFKNIVAERKDDLSAKFMSCWQTLKSIKDESEKDIFAMEMEKIVEEFVEKHQDLSESEMKISGTVSACFKLLKVMMDLNEKRTTLVRVDFNEVKDLLNKCDSEHDSLNFDQLGNFFSLLCGYGWIRSARVFHDCLCSCYESLKKSENTAETDGDRKAISLLLVYRGFRLGIDKRFFLKNLLMMKMKKRQLIAEIDEKTAEICKGLKDYKESKELPDDVKDFKDAEAIARAMIKVHDQLEDDHPKYKECLDNIKSFVRSPKNITDMFVPNSKYLVRAEAYEVLTLQTEDPKMRYKLLKKSEDFQRKHRTCIEVCDIQGFL